MWVKLCPYSFILAVVYERKWRDFSYDCCYNHLAQRYLGIEAGQLIQHQQENMRR